MNIAAAVIVLCEEKAFHNIVGKDNKLLLCKTLSEAREQNASKMVA